MTAVAASPKNLVGQNIAQGRYNVRAILGQGSMGYVFRAFDERLQTEVVIKVPTAAKLEHPQYHQRFLQESRFLVKLSHPHIVKILDIGEDEGIPFFVMQFVEGGSLRDQAMREVSGQKLLQAVPLESLSDWLLPVAKALDFMHQQGYLHRDVKPANILFDQHGHAYLSDFGLSKLVLDADETDSAMTNAGAIVGTPSYVAPEIVLGQDYDGRADQYSLALTVYEMLTGVIPFEGPTGSATFVNQTTMRAPPLTQLNPDISGDLSKRVLKAIAKSPANRYPSCVAFAESVLSAVFSDRSSGTFNNQSTQATHAPIVRPPVVKGTARSATTHSSTVSSRASQARAKPKSQTQPSQDSDELPPPPHRTVVTKAGAKKSSGARPGMVKRYIIAGTSKGTPGQVPCPHCRRLVKFPVSYAGKRGLCIVCQERLQVSGDLKKLTWLKIKEFPADDSDAIDATRVLDSSVNESEFNLVLGERLFGWRLSRQQTMWLTLGLIALLVMLGIYFSIESQKEPPKTKKGSMEVGWQLDWSDFHQTFTRTAHLTRHSSAGQPGFETLFDNQNRENGS